MELELKSRSSQLRHRPTNTAEQVTPVAARQSRPSQILRRRTAAQPAPKTQDQALLDNLTTQSYQYQQRPPRLQYQADVYTDDDQQIAPSTRNQGRSQRRPAPQRPAPDRHKLILILLAGMLLGLVVWSLLLHVGVWYINTFRDPAAYTQTAHLDVTIVTDPQGHRSQGHAFIDAQNHIDIVVIPDGDASKARMIVGPVITQVNAQVSDPQHTATVTASAHGTIVTVVVAGPLVANWLTTSQPTAQWATDISKGGK